MRYQVIVGNIGKVCDTDDRAEALRDYDIYKARSEDGIGRAAGEPIALMCNGEPIMEHAGTLED